MALRTVILSPSRAGLRPVVAFESTARSFVVSDVGVLGETSPPAATIVLTGIASVEALGALSFVPGIVSISLTGIASAETLGGITFDEPTGAYNELLRVSIDQGHEGHNYKDNRSIWHGVSELTLSSGGIDGALWYQDDGPRGMALERLEPRAFCTKGAASFDFTGVTLLVRLNVAWSWFTGATVTIDGVAPSTLGIDAARDTLSCDAATWQLTADDYIDVIVADGLADTLHTCVITANSDDPAKFFSIAGFKVGTTASQEIDRSGGWLVATAQLLDQNKVTVTLKNYSSSVIVLPTLSFPPALVSGSGAALSNLTAAQLAPGASLTQVILPAFTGEELSGEFSYTLGLSGQYHDAAGLITATISQIALVGDAAWVVTGTWFTDTSTPTVQTRIFSSANPATAHIHTTFNGDSLDITVQTSAGWSTLGIYAADNTTLLHSIDCSTDTGGALATSTLTGFGLGDHTIYLRKTTNDGLFVVLVSLAWEVTQTFTELTEIVVLNYAAQQPVAMRVVGGTMGTFDLTYTAPVIGASDYSGTPVRLNEDLSYTEALSRFPTYAVYYKAGNRELLAGYDRLIIDPLGARTSDVIYWQSLGIKVYGYISMGEESGVYSDRYDFASTLGPWPGSGPGGFGEWYMYTQNPVSGPPDKNSVWASYYLNPDPAFGWPQRIEDYYIPQVLGGPLVLVKELVTVAAATIGGDARLVFDVVHAPVDADEDIIVTNTAEDVSFLIYQDFTFDVKTGAFVLAANTVATEGQQLKVSYTRKGHQCDGIFLDTVDTPDVYTGFFGVFPSVPVYAGQFAAMINEIKTNHPSLELISNRGFTVLADIIASCSGVMFETWLTTPTDIEHLADTDYEIITDPATIAYNDAANAQLLALRADNVFDVYSLNYCLVGEAGDELRTYCRTQDAIKGYLSWQAVINLDQPTPNNPVTVAIPAPGAPPANDPFPTPGLPVVTNVFTRVRVYPI